jgi:hypothetical protein
MKTQMILAALAVFSISSAFASEESVAGRKTKRVRCTNISNWEPMLRVRGTLQISDRGEARGNIQITTDNAGGGYNTMFAGTYNQNGRMEFAELTDTRDRMLQIYIDFTDNGMTGNSYVQGLRGGFQRMTCNAN